MSTDYSKDSNHRLKVQFYFQDTAPREIGDSTVVIMPSKDGWNDFGKRVLAEVRVKFKERIEPYHTGILLGFVENETQSFGTERFEDALGSIGPVSPEELKYQYFTMLSAIEDYRRLVTTVGEGNAKLLLLSINDVVAANEFQRTSKWIAEAEKSSVFTHSFMRSSQSYFAYKNAGSILYGLQHEDLGSISSALQIRFKLAGRANPYDLRFEFDQRSELPKRIAVVIGKNGVGKSQTLSRIALAAMGEANTALHDEKGNRASINRLLAFAPNNEADSVFPNEKPKTQRIWYRRFSMNRSKRMRKGRSTSDLILQLARSELRIQNRTRWSIFIEAIQALSAPETICLLDKSGQNVLMQDLRSGPEQALLERFSSLDLSKEPVRAHKTASYPLSSGEISFVKFAAQLCLNIENGTLVLLDEPETHLHPNFINRFASLLDSVLRLTGSVAIIATHSVYFVKEVFKEQVTVLRLIDSELQVDKPFMQTFGSDVGAISYFVFGEDEPTRLASKLEDELIQKYKTWEVIAERFKGDLSIDYLNDLRSKTEGES